MQQLRSICASSHMLSTQLLTSTLCGVWNTRARIAYVSRWKSPLRACRSASLKVMPSSGAPFPSSDLRTIQQRGMGFGEHLDPYAAQETAASQYCLIMTESIQTQGSVAGTCSQLPPITMSKASRTADSCANRRLWSARVGYLACPSRVR